MAKKTEKTEYQKHQSRIAKLEYRLKKEEEKRLAKRKSRNVEKENE